MLKTYRVISSVFILFLFGFTLITASPVFAEDSPEFIACQQMKGKKEKKNCFRDLASRLRGTPVFIVCQKVKGEKEKKNCFRDLARADHKQLKGEANLCLASLKEIDERTFRNCNSPADATDIRLFGGKVCYGKSPIMWHNRYEGGMIDEIRKCGESNELINQKECSSALSDLALVIEEFDEERNRVGKIYSKDGGGICGHPTCRYRKDYVEKDWWYATDVWHGNTSTVGIVNGSWRDARDACGF